MSAPELLSFIPAPGPETSVSPSRSARRVLRHARAGLLLAVLGLCLALGLFPTKGAQAQETALKPPQDYPASWDREFPLGDFSRSTIDFNEVLSGGPPRDGIPAIDEPAFVTVAEAQAKALYTAQEPVIGLEIGGEAKAYPLQILTWHEIANDVVGGVPVAVTYCPLCNAAIVFDTRVEGQALTFGVSGRLRKSDMIMYDRETESWWQQFSGAGLTGVHAGGSLTKVPSRIESFERFAQRFPQGQVLVPNGKHRRQYGRNPYRAYDAEDGRPFLYFGDLPADIPPMARVVVAQGYEAKAYALSLIAEQGVVRDGALELRWFAGQNSALDTSSISQGRDVGNITAHRVEDDGARVDLVHDVTFAFVYHAFEPEGEIVQ